MDGNNYNNNNQNGSSDSFYSYNNGSQSNQNTRTQDISRTVLTRMVDIRIPTVHFIRTHSRLVKNKRKREKENRVDLENSLQNVQHLHLYLDWLQAVS